MLDKMLRDQLGLLDCSIKAARESSAHQAVADLIAQRWKLLTESSADPTDFETPEETAKREADRRETIDSYRDDNATIALIERAACKAGWNPEGACLYKWIGEHLGGDAIHTSSSALHHWVVAYSHGLKIEHVDGSNPPQYLARVDSLVGGIGMDRWLNPIGANGSTQSQALVALADKMVDLFRGWEWPTHDRFVEMLRSDSVSYVLPAPR